MDSDLRALYQEVIIDHSRNPRNYGNVDQPNCSAEGVNPLCGDELQITCVMDENEVIQDIRFEGRGCAIFLSSASIMTEMLKGKSKTEANELFEQFRTMITSDPRSTTVNFDKIGKLEALSGVREFPTRIKCATLAWHTAKSALEHSDETVTTE